VIVLLLFGAPKLPGLARSIGQSMKIFRNEIKDPNKDEQSVDPVTDLPVAQADSAQADSTTAAPKSKPKP
jgi:sec-independent protein translocase protein TatA